MIEDRHHAILALLKRHGEISVSEFSKLLEVSEVTVRSDLKALANSGEIRRTRGSARLPSEIGIEASLEETTKQQVLRSAELA